MSNEIGNLGLGLRREMLDDVLSSPPKQVDFYEVAPENWIKFGGKLARKLAQISDNHTLICHGLSLSLGRQRR